MQQLPDSITEINERGNEHSTPSTAPTDRQAVAQSDSPQSVRTESYIVTGLPHGSNSNNSNQPLSLEQREEEEENLDDVKDALLAESEVFLDNTSSFEMKHSVDVISEGQNREGEEEEKEVLIHSQRERFGSNHFPQVLK